VTTEKEESQINNLIPHVKELETEELLSPKLVEKGSSKD
jgi:hypothetical protein